MRLNMAFLFAQLFLQSSMICERQYLAFISAESDGNRDGSEMLQSELDNLEVTTTNAPENQELVSTIDIQL